MSDITLSEKLKAILRKLFVYKCKHDWRLEQEGLFNLNQKPWHKKVICAKCQQRGYFDSMMNAVRSDLSLNAKTLQDFNKENKK